MAVTVANADYSCGVAYTDSSAGALPGLGQSAPDTSDDSALLLNEWDESVGVSRFETTGSENKLSRTFRLGKRKQPCDEVVVRNSGEKIRRRAENAVALSSSILDFSHPEGSVGDQSDGASRVEI